MGVKMNNAPVYFTIGQVQFNPILNLDTYVPAIQAKMRAMQFPDYKTEMVQEFILPGVGMQTAPAHSNQVRYRFGDIHGWQGFLLEQNRLSFFTTRYDVFQDFLAHLQAGVQILHDEMQLGYTERLSLRYLDAVQPDPSAETLAHFLTPEVLGLSQKFANTKMRQSLSETLTESGSGYMVSRVIIRHGQIGMPIELAGLATQLEARFTGADKVHAIIDTDAFYEQREAFDLSKIATRLHALHGQIEESFSQTVTPYAREKWA